MEEGFSNVLKQALEKVFEDVGGGLKESIYQNAVAIALRRKGYTVQKEINHSVYYCAEDIGTVRIDMIVNSGPSKELKFNKVIIEFKAIIKLGSKEINQVKRYLKLLEHDQI